MTILVNISICGMELFDAKSLVEAHFGPQNWPTASCGKTSLKMTDTLSITIELTPESVEELRRIASRGDDIVYDDGFMGTCEPED